MLLAFIGLVGAIITGIGATLTGHDGIEIAFTYLFGLFLTASAAIITAVMVLYLQQAFAYNSPVP